MNINLSELRAIVPQIEQNSEELYDKNGTLNSQVTSLIKSTHDSLINTSAHLSQQRKELLITKNMNLDQIWEQIQIHSTKLEKILEKDFKQIAEKFQISAEDTAMKVANQDANDDDDQIEQQEESQNDGIGSMDDQDDMSSPENEVEEVISQKQKVNDDEELEDDQDFEEDDLDDAEGDQLDQEQEFEDDDNEDEENEETLNEDQPIVNQQNKNLNNQNQEKTKKSKNGKNKIEDDLDLDDLQRFLDYGDKLDLENAEKSDTEEELGDDYEFSDGQGDDEEGDQEEEGEEGDFDQEGDMRDDYEDSGETDARQKPSAPEGDIFQMIPKRTSKQQREEEMNDAEVEDEVFENIRDIEMDLRNEERQADLKTQKQSTYVEGDDQISRIEKKMIDPKSWQVKGEIHGQDRPINSLLEQAVDFKLNKKISEEITQQFTDSLEATIKQRILDEAFDDRVQIVFDAAFKENFQNLVEVNTEKSQKGLADLYEDEFRNKLNLPTANKEDQLKLEILNLFKQVSYKLDALSNLNFTPKPVLNMASVQVSDPVVDYQEKVPIFVNIKDSEKKGETFEARNAHFQEKQEMDHEEQVRLRRNQKRSLKQKLKEKQQKTLTKTLQIKGQTKHQYNLNKKAKKTGVIEAAKQNQKSVEFTQTNQFFKNLQNSLTAPKKDQKIQTPKLNKQISQL